VHKPTAEKGSVMTRFLIVLGFVGLFAPVGTAAGLDGKWVASFTTPDGVTRENIFSFKVEGHKLTGTVSSPTGHGASRIEHGSVDGDTFSFTIRRKIDAYEMTFKYNGRIAGDEIRMTVDGGDQGHFDIVARRSRSSR
jgi:hypothetical protein